MFAVSERSDEATLTASPVGDSAREEVFAFIGQAV
jgi:hypothetical protein